MVLAPGTRLGAYEILGPLGSGGMGEVHLARDTRLGREIALKVLPADLAGDPERLARFEREARAAAALNHPNIVVLHSIEEAAGVRFLTMERVEGRTLAEVAAGGSLALARLLDVAIPLASALAAAHERGVVHRDLKPANVMLAADGRLKILDFGLAKLAGEDAVSDATQAATRTPLSAPGHVLGTVPYMSPEQIRGAVVDARTDLFSLGIVLYELATGRRPFGGGTSADVASAILRDTPEPARAVRADLPADLERILARCLEKDPERRFRTARDVRDELEVLRVSVTGAAAASPAPAAKEPPSIAVLPFENRSRDEDDAYFAEGLADELLNVLAKIRGLRVAARASARQFRGPDLDLAAVGRRLGVATLLEGSVRKSGSRVRIAVHLVSVADGFHLWSETYDRTLDDIFAVQDDIAQSVVKELRATLLGEAADSRTSGEVRAEVAAAAQGRGTDPESHRLFLQGRYFVQRLGQEDIQRGLVLLRQAVQVDPRNALAWASLGWSETVAAITGPADFGDAIGRARSAIARAVELAPELPEAQLALGGLQHWYDLESRSAAATISRALERAPGHVELLRAAGNIALARGRFAEAIALLQRGFEADPLEVLSHTLLARTYRLAGKYAESEDMFRRSLVISNDATSSHLLLALVLSAVGRHAEAVAEAAQEQSAWSRLYGLAITQHFAGDAAASDSALAELVATCSDHAAYQIAAAHAARGEYEASFRWLDEAYRLHDSGCMYSKVEPYFAPMHSDPRWEPHLRRLQLDD